MKIFVTGGTGYVGHCLVSKLLEMGHQVNLLCRQAPDDDFHRHPNLGLFQGDLLDEPAIRTAMAGCEQVYHVAAYARAWARDPKTYFKVNVLGTVNILDAALVAGV